MTPRPRSRPRRIEPAPTPRGPAAFVGYDFETLDLAATLLVFQAGLGLVSAAGVIFLGVVSGGHPLYILASIAAICGPMLAMLCAHGLTRARRWARHWTIIYEVVILLGVIVRFIFVRELAFGLVLSITSIILPLTIVGFVLSPTARAAVRAARHPKLKRCKRRRKRRIIESPAREPAPSRPSTYPRPDNASRLMPLA